MMKTRDTCEQKRKRGGEEGKNVKKRKINLKRSKRRQRVSEEDFMRRNSDCFLAGLDGSLLAAVAAQFRGC